MVTHCKETLIFIRNYTRHPKISTLFSQLQKIVYFKKQIHLLCTMSSYLSLFKLGCLNITRAFLGSYNIQKQRHTRERDARRTQ